MVDNGDGTALDPVSCLLWQKSPDGDPPGTWQLAESYCANNTPGLPGTGWALPTISQLRSLVRNCPQVETGGTCGVTDSCLSFACLAQNSYACNACDVVGCVYWDSVFSAGVCYDYWSSLVYADYPTKRWGIHFDSAHLFAEDTQGGRFVRCVRQGP